MFFLKKRLMIIFICFIVQITNQLKLGKTYNIFRVRRQLKSSCTLPEHPENGKWTIYGSTNSYLKPGDITNLTTVLQIDCQNQYVLSGQEYLICLDGKWNHDLPQCLLVSSILSFSPNRGKCILPEQPQHGKWSVQSSSNQFKPGEFVFPSTILEIECEKNYVLKGPQFLLCFDGTWNQKLPQCLRICSSVESTNVTIVSCSLNGFKQDCKYPVSGTVAKFSCAPFYEDFKLVNNPNRYCIDGTWNNISPKCIPVCGKKSFSATLPIVGGKSVSEYPWQVALYDKQKRFLCGAALISQRVILTAAHCVTTSNGQKRPKENYIVAAGKYYSKFDDERDKDISQHSRLMEIYIPDEYRGDAQKYSYNIAVLVTEKMFMLNQYVLPVCIDWERNKEHLLLQPNVEGTVTGWGFPSPESRQPSEVLKEITLPYVDYSKCLQDLPKYFASYLTADKFCAGYLNQSKGVCAGDSGSSIVFRNVNDERYYTLGIVSIGPSSGGLCDIQQYALYSKVSKQLDFIQRIVQMYTIIF